MTQREHDDDDDTYTNEPSASERLDRVQYAHLLVIQREQELAKATRAPLLKFTHDTITTVIEGLL